MANKTNAQGEQGRFDMKLDLSDPREEEVNNFLKARKGEASQLVKMLIYQYATGRDWYTNLPLQPALQPVTRSLPVVQEPQDKGSNVENRALLPEIFNEDDLDALDDDLSSWGNK